MTSSKTICSTCGKETTDPTEDQAQHPDNWVFLFVTWNRKKACFCRQCYDVIYDGWMVTDEN